MKRLLLTVLTFLFALILTGSLEGIAGQPNKEAGTASSRIGPQPAGQMSQTAGAVVENPVTDETYSGRDNVHGQLIVEVGQNFSITLASNATTGYHWELAAALDEAVVKLVANEYKAPETGMLGAGGQEIWTFRAMSRGEAVVQLKYVQPWEKDVTPVKTASYTVIVR
jgi:inhibitor of cysteine peptidase